MSDLDKAYKNLLAAAGAFNRAVDDIPRDHRRFKEAWEYKCRLQTVLGEWMELLKKWGAVDNFPMN